MTDSILEPPAMALPPADPRSAGLHRWRHFVSLSADLAFETDANGRFVLVIPETALGWPAGALVGMPSERLVGDDGTTEIVNPFRPAEELRRHRTLLRSFSGALAMMNISAVPLRDASGVIIGARGVGVAIGDADSQTSDIAGRLRHGQVLDRILSCVACETSADAMLDAAIWALIQALGAEGAAVIGAMMEHGPAEILHECGPGASAVLPSVVMLLSQPNKESAQTTTPQGRSVLMVRCRTRLDANGGLAIWRRTDGREWDPEDRLLAASAVAVVRIILEYEAVQREMAHQARTDPLTGLLNRRAFMEEMGRNIARLDRESEAGTLMYIDLDAFKAVNDRMGHATGDTVLIHLADMLRRMVRPSDLVARLGGDEFAVWLSGADRMTAAERADQLCKAAKIELPALLPDEAFALGVSVGIAMRGPGSHESIGDLTRRADMAMYEVKRGGRHHWRVSLLEGEG